MSALVVMTGYIFSKFRELGPEVGCGVKGGGGFTA